MNLKDKIDQKIFHLVGEAVTLVIGIMPLVLLRVMV